MNNRIINAENLADILMRSREKAGQTQKYMAKAMGKSIGTIRNWESGYATPNLIDTLQWFEILGLNALRYFLDFVYPDVYSGLKKDVDDEKIEEALIHYTKNVASPEEKRKMAYCIFGETGSSWKAQVDMITAHNHTSVRTRVNVAQIVYDSYQMEKARGELVGVENIMPNEDNLKKAIGLGKQAVIDGKEGYTNKNDSFTI